MLATKKKKRGGRRRRGARSAPVAPQAPPEAGARRCALRPKRAIFKSGLFPGFRFPRTNTLARYGLTRVNSTPVGGSQRGVDAAEMNRLARKPPETNRRKRRVRDDSDEEGEDLMAAAVADYEVTRMLSNAR